MGENTVGNRSPSRQWIKIGAQPISNVSVRINVAALGADVGYQRLTGWRDSTNAPQPVGLDPCAWRQMATLLLMGIATFLVAFVPTYAQIGVWGAIILTVLRFIQGVGVGGEWGGSVLLAMEWARSDHHRGFIAAWPQFGVPAGLFLANLAGLAFRQ